MSKAKILIVEDVPYNIDILMNILRDRYDVYVALYGRDVIRILEDNAIELVLMDINLPDIDGITLFKEIRNHGQLETLPVIFVSAIDDPHVKAECFEAGAVDYVTKPYNAMEVHARIKMQLKQTEAKRIVESQNALLEELVKAKTDEVSVTRDAAIRAFASLVETRDNDTGEHIVRTQNYVLILAETLKIMGEYADILTDSYINEIEKASPLHDIGKIGVPDNVLLKPGKLTDEEFEIIKQHTVIGYKALKNASKDLGKSDFFDIASDIAYYHHEKWDGTGYPKGLQGDAIPLAARIMALSDVYDALISERIYKKAFSHEKAREIIFENSGKHFDPQIVTAFINAEELFRKIAFHHS